MTHLVRIDLVFSIFLMAMVLGPVGCGGAIPVPSARRILLARGISSADASALVLAGAVPRARPLPAQLVSAPKPALPPAAGLERVQQLYRDLEFEAAQQTAQALIDAAERPGVARVDLDRLYRLRVLAGMNHLALGQAAAAAAHFRTAAATRPDALLAGDDYPPDVRQAYDVARTGLAAAPQVALRATTSPRAKVWLDGRSAGQTPTTLRAAPGLHRLRFEAALHVPQARWVRFAEGGEPLSLVLVPLAGPPLIAELGHRSPAALGPAQRAVVARTLSADVLLLAYPTNRGWRGVSLGLASGEIARGRAPTLADLLQTFEPPTEAAPLIESPWFWAAMGGGAALALGIGIGLGILLQPTSPVLQLSDASAR